MNRIVLLLLPILLLLNVTKECSGGGGPLLKIKIVDKEDEDPRVSATLLRKPLDPQINRRSFNVPLRRIYRPPSNIDPFISSQTYNPYTRAGMYHAGTAYSSHELTQSLGSLVTSILSSRNKNPVNKIYIFSRNNQAQPYSEPIYHVYQEQGNPAEKFIPSVQIQPSEVVIRPTIASQYNSVLNSHSPIAVATLGPQYHLPKVTEAVDDMVTETPINYAQQLKDLQKSIKKLTLKPMYSPGIKKSSVFNEKVRAYTNFMKQPEYFLPKVEPDHHTEPTNYYISSTRTQPQYEITPSATIQVHQYHPQKVSSTQPHAFISQSMEFTANDAIRAHPQAETDSGGHTKYRVYDSDSIKSSSSYTSANQVADLSEQGYTTQDAIRLLESKRYTVPRDCSSRCLEQNRKNYDPVCGSDERTYLNEDMLICLSACRKTDTEMDYQGPCN